MITNPNDGDILNDIPDNITIKNIASDFQFYNKKSVYYDILDSIELINGTNKPNIYIPIFEDPTSVLHQSLIEMQILCPSAVNFIDEFNILNIDFETLMKNTDNNYITKLIYT